MNMGLNISGHLTVLHTVAPYKRLFQQAWKTLHLLKQTAVLSHTLMTNPPFQNQRSDPYE